MPRTVSDLRGEISRAVGISSPPSGAFRKDDLNVILDALGGDSLPPAEVYGWDAPGKSEFYERVADAAGFDYDPGEGDNARPFNRDELSDLLDAVE